MRILFTGGGGAPTGAWHRVYGGSRHQLFFADADPTSKPLWLKAEQWVTIPPASDPTFLEALSDVCRERAIDLVVPGVDEELPLLADGQVPCRVLVPSDAFVKTHLDKQSSMAALEYAGLPSCAAWLGFPLIVKPRSGRGSRHVRLVHSREEMNEHIRLSGIDDFVCQRYLEGQEYTVTVVADRAERLRAVVPVKVLKKRGITIQAETDADPAVTELCQAIFSVFPVSGVFNVQAIKDADGTVWPFEINPRVSTTTPLAVAAGVDVIGLAMEGELVAHKSGVKLMRSWLTEFEFGGK